MNKPQRTWSGSQFKTTAAPKGHESAKGYGSARKFWDSFICNSCDIEFSSYIKICPHCGKQTARI